MERPPAATGAPSLVGLQSGSYRPDLPPSSATGSFKLDEGYSDETRSQAENEVAQVSRRGSKTSWMDSRPQ